MPLTIDAGFESLQGQREANEDFGGMTTPNEPDLTGKGIICALADGVSGHAGGREAAEYTVRGLLADYYATPDTWPATQCLDRVLRAINSWVLQHGALRREMSGMATTLTTLVLRGQSYYFAHAGDTRLYLLREQKLQRLTTDHVWDRPEMQHVLTRAVGLDRQLTLDHGMGDLREGDIFVLLSDGVWASLPDLSLQAILQRAPMIGCQHAAQELTAQALQAGGRDNASALVLRVTTLPPKEWRDSLADSRRLPLPPRLRAGQVFERLRIEELLHNSQSALVYRVSDPQAPYSPPLVLKTLPPETEHDARARSAFAHEEWLAKRLAARFFPQVINAPERSYLYYLATYHAGHTLQQRFDSGHHFTVPELLQHAENLVRAVAALHRRNIIHRDIKPANIHLGDDGQLRILDLGVAHSGRDADDDFNGLSTLAGTPSYLAPEQFDNRHANAQTDLYAVGVTLYYLATRHYPYNEIEPFQHPRFGQAPPLSRYRPDCPLWLDRIILKAVAKEPSQRFETAEEMLLALERGGALPLPALAPLPLLQRAPQTVWRAIALISLVGNLLLLYLLAVRKV